ncbi:MAG: sigma-E factor negative regulatory protein [Sulfurimicrobium sp.]|jgi:sigma-E factor negative regulatory protein RseA|nr:sigma-E factor negative regulatory protein [Sulfurimicrobium sp.]MDP1896548.1 sigma-E factor negative regulatory protein [Sulfurimicrobium sp.]MDP2963970.1 sigma-E factor negative regulatory protein [Sulfurimicrobium sp.]MDZ7655229.1 sigma-E factor negative regulatory protein [Sulfurimicrobium sp.]
MKERISEFMDGEVDDAQAKRLIAILQDSEAHQEWHAYHLIGDELRGTSNVSSDFMERFSMRLAEEPTVLAPNRLAKPRQRSFALSAAASVAAVGFVVWAVMQTDSERATSGMMVAKAPHAELSSANVNPYLLAHQEYSPSVAMQGVRPYVQTVSEVREAAAR